MHPLVARGIAILQKEAEEELMEAYQLFDMRGKGYFDGVALTEAMKALNYEVDRRQVVEMIAAIDETGKGVITKETFKKFMTGRLDHRDEAEIKEAFDYFLGPNLGPNKKEAISLQDIERVAEELGEDKKRCS